MNYLVFDIECCDGKHICEFGYVVFDEQFNILNRECMLVNPDKPFKLSARGHQANIVLNFTEEEYYASPKFPQVYNRIKEIIEGENRILGFSAQSDKKFLSTACSRYGLPAIKYESLDFQKLYKIYTGAQNVTSVEKMLAELNIEEVILHKSDEDAFAIMLAIQKICQKEGLSVEEILNNLTLKNAEFLKKRAQAKAKAKKQKRFFRDKKRAVTIGDIIASKNEEE